MSVFGECGEVAAVERRAMVAMDILGVPLPKCGDDGEYRLLDDGGRLVCARMFGGSEVNYAVVNRPCVFWTSDIAAATTVPRPLEFL